MMRKRPVREHIRFVLSVLLLCALATGCGLTRQSMNIDYNDQRLNDGLEGVLRGGESARLRDFTSWSWDEVHLFHEHADRNDIEATVGAPVIKGPFYDSKASLLVFENAGKPVKAIGIEGDYLRGDDNRVSWPDDVTLAPWGKGCLLMSLPGPN